MSSLSTDFLKIGKNISFYKNLQSSGEFYIFTGKPTAWDVNELIPGFVIPTPSINALALKDETKDIIAMKKIKSSDVSLAIKRYNWVQGTIYDSYDVYDDNLLRKQFYSGTKPFYVMTSEYNVYKCLKEGTEISTPNGWIKIENLNVNDQVYDCEGITKITDIQSRIVDQIIKIKVRGLELISSTDHIHLVSDSSGNDTHEVLAKDIKIGDWVLIPNSQNFNEISTVDLGNKFSKHCKWWPDQITLDESWARLIGLYLAEGCMGKYGRGYKVIWSFGGHEERLADEVVSILDSKGIHSKKQFQICKNATFGESKCWIVICCSMGLYTLFEKLELGYGCKTKNVPNVPTELVLPLISGWLDGDGTQTKYTLSGWSISKQLIKNLWKLLLKVDICANISGNGNSLTITGSSNIKKIVEFTERFICPSYEDKQSPKLLKCDKGWMSKITSIELKDVKTKVISIETESHKYIAEGIETHNCLSNNHGSPSIEQPSGQFLAPVVLSDNYKWKFMFNVSEEDRVKFLSSSYIPLKGNFELPSTSAQYRMSSSAIAGTIETIDVSSPGANYNQGTSEILFAGDGSGLAATITITSGGLTNVSVTNPGSGYNSCSVSVIDNDSVYSPAIVKPQFSPPGGHGFNCANELGAFYTIVSVDLLGSEDAIFPLNAYFRKTGILTEFKDINGTFTSQDFYYGPAHPYYNDTSLRTSNPTKFLKDYSGQILYINYHEPVQRKATQLERIKLIIETN